MKKRAHHYVWKYYLKPWTNNNQIYCKRNGNIFLSNLDGIANQRDFYKLKELSDNDIFWIRKLAIENVTDPVAKETHEKTLNLFLKPYKLMNQIRQKNLNSTEFETLFDEVITNFEEDYHARIESDSIDILENLQNGNIEYFVDDINRLRMVNFLVIQYFRTKKLKENICKRVNNESHFSIDKTWNILSHIFATNVGASIYADKSFRIISILNKSQIPFITGDQPIFNTYSLGIHPKDVPMDLEFFYPISPNISYLFSKRDVYSTNSLSVESDDQVDAYNKSIILESHEQVFSNSAGLLSRYVHD